MKLKMMILIMEMIVMKTIPIIVALLVDLEVQMKVMEMEEQQGIIPI